jgi:L-threonate 2-dehydrogenase
MSRPVIAVIAMGDMGAGIAARLVRGGAEVITSLRNRSAASVQRAWQAGVRDASDAEIAAASYLLSIVPPAQAQAVAEHWCGIVAQGEERPVYLDCNAISTETAAQIADVAAGAGVRFVDASIIGAPGTAQAPGPALYLAGEESRDLAFLAQHGLRARSTGGPAGAASALKMAYAGFNKGLTGLAAAMVLAATRAGAADALRVELSESQPHLLKHIAHTLPDMYGKAWRWDFEMLQVAQFAGRDEDVARLFQAMANFYGNLGRDWAAGKQAAAAMDAFLQREGNPP